MHPQPVEDQEHLATCIADQAPEEDDQHGRGDRAIEHHPAQFALVAHHRDHADIGALVAGTHDRRLAARGITAAADIIGAQAALVAPEDRALLPPRLGLDDWVVLLQPVPHRVRLLLIGPPQRLLRRELPACQVGPHRAHRQPHAAALLDQGRDRRPAPQREGQAIRIRRAAADQPADGRLLGCGEEPPGAGRRATLAGLQPQLPAFPEPLADVEHPVAGQPDLQANRLIGQPTLAQADHLPPTLLLRLRRQAPHVPMFHHQEIGTPQPLSKTARTGSIVLNATTLNTGHNWQFTATWMGERPGDIDSDFDGNYRLRRPSYNQAPEPYAKTRPVRLGIAVAASASVPGLFDPLILKDLYEHRSG